MPVAHKLGCNSGCQGVSGLGVATFGVRYYLTAPGCAVFRGHLPGSWGDTVAVSKTEITTYICKWLHRQLFTFVNITIVNIHCCDITFVNITFVNGCINNC